MANVLQCDFKVISTPQFTYKDKKDNSEKVLHKAVILLPDGNPASLIHNGDIHVGDTVVLGFSVRNDTLGVRIVSHLPAQPQSSSK
ncbi:MAG: hypothetical protein RR764_09925 [Oscillospiraceae bacterium]